MATTCIALLRGVNVGGRTTLAMADLRAFLADVGLENPRTLLQSGNAVFSTRRAATAPIEALLERELKARLHFETDFFVRTASEWNDVVGRNPFLAEATNDPSHLILICLKREPQAAAVKRLEAAIKGRERLKALGRELFIVYPDGIGRSKLAGSVIEKALETRGTARNWNTVLKLQALVGSPV